MDYWKYTITTDPETAELLVAFIAEAAFDTFEDHETGLYAYLPAAASEAEAEATLAEVQEQFEFTWTKTFIPGQNWNKIWESNFHPVIVGDFCAVRADFHEPIRDTKWELVINPKMAFGSGHHETTWQCLAALEHLPVQDAHIFDYGCGTGILAIMASKLGAAHLEAIDIEEESYLNTIENSRINEVHNVTARCGTLDQVTGSDFDGILANINRNVILDSLPTLYSLTKPGGWLLVSGILEQDDQIVTETAQSLGYKKDKQTQRGNWLCIVFYKH